MGLVYTLYEEPVIKHYTEVEPGDVCIMEYGDYDNFVTIIIDSLSLVSGGSFVECIGRYSHNGNEFKGYGPNYTNQASYKIIGKEIK